MAVTKRSQIYSSSVNKLPDTAQEDAIPAARADDFSSNDVVKVRSSSHGAFPYSLFNWSNPIDFERRLTV